MKIPVEQGIWFIYFSIPSAKQSWEPESQSILDKKGRKRVDRARERKEGRKRRKETVITSCGNYSKGPRGKRRYYTAGFGARKLALDKPRGKICLG